MQSIVFTKNFGISPSIYCSDSYKLHSAYDAPVGLL
jgi:hypothetical protein